MKNDSEFKCQNFDLKISWNGDYDDVFISDEFWSKFLAFMIEIWTYEIGSFCQYFGIPIYSHTPSWQWANFISKSNHITYNEEERIYDQEEAL